MNIVSNSSTNIKPRKIMLKYLIDKKKSTELVNIIKKIVRKYNCIFGREKN